MKKSLISAFAFLIATVFCAQIVSAQITITLPKMPKIKKPKIVQTQEPEATTATGDNTQTVQDNNSEQPTTSQNSAKQEDEPMDARISLFLSEIAKSQKSVSSYTPEDKLYLVGGSETEWLWRAVSPKERSEFIEKWKVVMTPDSRKRFDTELDALAAAAAGKLPEYKSGLSKFTFHNAAEERLMKSVLTKIADYKIFSLGLKEGSWLIDKNDLGIPTARYKHGVIYLRDTKSDHPYCYATYINIKQDYAGGGTYGASYARFIEDEMVGCPANGK